MNKEVVIQLTGEDFMIATTKGAMRYLVALKQNRSISHGGKSLRKMGQRLSDGIIGELGEIAVARYTRLPVPPSSSNTMKLADVGDTIDVRTTEHTNGHLTLYDNANPNYNFVLVTLDCLTATIRGWINPKDGKKPEYFRSADPDCYFVPQSALNPIETLPIK
jgi:hypothetical protein